jgi:molybdate transport system substrate-binding protein
MSVAGIDMVGPLPADVNNITAYAAGIGAGSQQADAATALIRFLHSPEAQAVFKAKGLKPTDAPKGT